MHRIVFVVYPGFEILDVSGPGAVFSGANHALGGEAPFYEIELLSGQGGPVASSSGIVVETRGIDAPAAPSIDTLLVVGAEREPLLRAMADPALGPLLARLAGRAGRWGSICSGIFVLAALGLVDGRRVATHWDACTPLAKAFPKVEVDPDSLYVVDGHLWTSAGVTTGIDMALAMVAADLGAKVAGEVAQRLVLYARRPGYQSQFSPVLQAQARADSPFGELIAWIQGHLQEPLDVPALAARAGLAERTFHRRFVAATGVTPARFVETARLDAARMLLSRGLSLKSVAVQVGLFPAARFAEAFERRFGMSPRLFRDMHAGG
ncbi:helix-turn-helix domain-containing protein [Pigmentiphaga sp.]|uniref:GlxA family transcriptional regulator n=1 Tax=Pigmentiphaga sp. TaxID=1977564 RepID=UPI00128E7EFB|nr:helix-turn-helix domain-containing protein [Pigmentiphaga sp.]MPS26213.1 helix-turn-helix domain-containing protein [Alcaligenaceae bacterium SAGV5]MPS53279.1 helix-turn-helix domain-containing protein [Alcaligenaceae bacterium SAGV3]MPT57757.1 helix-turn-helix domain-containing protein [Alcaligenaceae bacterium]